LRSKGVKLGVLITGLSITILLLNLLYFFTGFSLYEGHFSTEKGVLLVSLAVYLITYALILKRVHFLNFRISAAATILTGMIFLTFFAPLVAVMQPEEILNAAECRLLAPGESKIVIVKNMNLSIYEKSNTLVGDSLAVKEGITLYGKNKIQTVDTGNSEESRKFLNISKVTFLLGTDEFGRDLFSRTLYGARYSLFIGISAAMLAFIIASVIAYISCFTIKTMDLAANRFADIFLAVPSLFIIIFAISIFGHNLAALIAVLAITSWMSLFKILNGEIKRLNGKNYIISSKMLGVPGHTIFLKDILPVMMPSIIVNFIFLIANFIIVESSLSFLGLGPGDEYPSWGGIIESGLSYMSRGWWMILFPGLFLIITISALNRTGNTLEVELNLMDR